MSMIKYIRGLTRCGSRVTHDLGDNIYIQSYETLLFKTYISFLTHFSLDNDRSVFCRVANSFKQRSGPTCRPWSLLQPLCLQDYTFLIFFYQKYFFKFVLTYFS